MIRHICILLCITMVLGMVAGCSTKPSANPDLDNSAKDKAKPDSKSADLLHDTGKINKDVVRGNMDFAFNIFRQFNREDRENNIFISPLSISTVLAMTYQGAQGATRESMARALGYSGIDISVLNESYKNLLRHLMKLDEKIQLNIENSVWIRDGEPVEEDFLTVNKDIFRAQVETLDFSNDQAIEVINEWVSHATNGKINKILEPPIAPETIMYLINAIYFNGDWSEKFDKDRTFKSRFHSGGGSLQDVMMMSREGRIQYGQGEDFIAVRLPYGKENTAMYCVLPKGELPINDFIEGLDGEKWEAIRESIAERNDVKLNLPRFKMEYGIKSLKESLTSLGMGNAFTTGADFSGIRGDLCISDVLHKAIIEVNEEGSEAAAVTAVDMVVTAVVEPIEFIADRPFFFAIVDDITGTILFMGKAYDLD